MKHMNRMIGGTLLVSGTTIGAGMLALPIVTGIAGFIPAIFLLISCWILMSFTGLLMLEVNLWMKKEDANLITMARFTLGKWGEWISWGAYMFLLYALTTAYIAGSTPIIIGAIKAFTGVLLPSYFGALILLLIFSIAVYKGTESVDYLNRVLMLCLAILYFLLVYFLTPYVSYAPLSQSDWSSLSCAAPVVLTAFGFHIIIPTLSSYLDHDVKELKYTILIGSFIPLIVYSIWVFLSLGIIPADQIAFGHLEGLNGAQLMNQVFESFYLGMILHLFSFFVIITSFLGVSLSLSDFLADGLQIKRNKRGKLLLYSLTFLPPTFFSMLYPRAFLSALEYAGAFGVVVLLCLMPALMVWRGRYYLKLPKIYQAPGGKLALLLVIALSICIILLELVGK